MADKEKTLKTYIVQRTYEVIVSAYDRDDAIFRTSDATTESSKMTKIKCGTPKQMKHTDVE